MANGWEVGAGWIGVDLDGTLAEYDTWRGKEHIGRLIPEMYVRVVKWLNAGETVKIFTARACDPNSIPGIQRWLAEHGLGGLEVTNVKDWAMKELWDDRCYRVVANTGKTCCEEQRLRNGQPLL